MEQKDRGDEGERTEGDGALNDLPKVAGLSAAAVEDLLRGATEILLRNVIAQCVDCGRRGSVVDLPPEFWGCSRCEEDVKDVSDWEGSLVERNAEGGHSPEENARRSSREETIKARRREKMREKVVQGLKDFWRPYHGSTAHRDDADGNQMVEKKKSGGHMPLNAAVMAIMDPETEKEIKLLDARELLSRELYRLAVGTREEILMFAHIQDLFGRYGAGDSDYDELLEGASRDRQAGREMPPPTEIPAAPPRDLPGGNPRKEKPKARRVRMAANKKAPEPAQRCSVRRHLKALVVDAGIDLITQRLIEAGVKGNDFWADWGLPGFFSTRTRTKYDDYRRYYLKFLEECDRLRRENPGKTRVRVRAAQNVAKAEGTTERTVFEAVAQCESGYVDLGDPEEDQGSR